MRICFTQGVLKENPTQTKTEALGAGLCPATPAELSMVLPGHPPALRWHAPVWYLVATWAETTTSRWYLKAALKVTSDYLILGPTRHWNTHSTYTWQFTRYLHSQRALGNKIQHILQSVLQCVSTILFLFSAIGKVLFVIWNSVWDEF